jgi:asparagine synthase (glutamine-hydrolysing)
VTGLRISGEVRLDNRDELARSLGVEPADRGRLSDLALILRAYDRWGEACAAKLLGDFAFTIHDDRTARAFGARDPMGVKPFYYRASERGLAFATRASAIAEADGLPLRLDEARVADVCVGELECVDRTSTFFLDVHRLPPGHKLTFAAGRALTAPYWTPDASKELVLKDDGAYVDGFRDVFAEAVRCRMTGATASMLSGGLDSSAIVGFARKESQTNGGPSLTTLSAVTDDASCQESPFIRAVLDLPGLDPVTIHPEDIRHYRRHIAAFISSMEEPFDDAMMLQLLMYAAARERGFDAVLDGVDGDVVASLEPDLLFRLLHEGRWGTAVREATGIARFYDGTDAHLSSVARLLVGSASRLFVPNFLRRAASPLRQRLGVRASLAESFIDRDLAERVGVADRLRTLWSTRSFRREISARERQADELVHPQYGAALERYHRVAASQGIEARHPFFDKRVVEFCLALPWDRKVRNGWSKWIVRESTEGVLPDSVRWRRGRWIHLGWTFLQGAIGELDELLADELSGDMGALAPYADLRKLRRLVQRYRSGDAGAGAKVWTAAVLSSWLRKTSQARYDLAARSNGPAALPRLPLVG